MFTSFSANDTMRLGESLGACLSKGTAIGLIGDLGSGKTCFVKGIYKKLANKEPLLVTSPTFTIVHEYKAAIPIFHFDVYRIKGIDDFHTIGFEDYLERGGICIVEWIDKIPGAINLDIEIKFEIINEQERRICFFGLTEKGKSIMSSLRGRL